MRLLLDTNIYVYMVSDLQISRRPRESEISEYCESARTDYGIPNEETPFKHMEDGSGNDFIRSQ